MAIATRSSLDQPDAVTSLEGFSVDVEPDDRLVARMAGLAPEEVMRRRAADHRPYVARLDAEPAAYGWVASRRASIGELGVEIELPAGHRYLWDFATLPAFRGRGIYPMLLGEIVRQESPAAARFWIIHAPENLPSAAGIRRAGFRPVGELSFDRDGSTAFRPIGDESLAGLARELLGVPIVSGGLDPCWTCSGCACEREEEGGACSCTISIGQSQAFRNGGVAVV